MERAKRMKFGMQSSYTILVDLYQMLDKSVSWRTMSVRVYVTMTNAIRKSRNVIIDQMTVWSRSHYRRVPDLKPDSTCMRVWCPLNLTLRVRRPSAGE
ncbi:hypothetical protein AVEN_213712-1 [Araneus ventricosus]|uniref:Uncharacterized protein n=1 Tax=Araneus ventricosus TaxID=182803 RepID=A0A4Y2GKS6_ARAVE|nr:hypothetical protein AVEN_213712-1 [Araneus ventricosus]